MLEGKTCSLRRAFTKQLGSAALLRLDRGDVCELRSLAQRSLQALQPCRVARCRRDGTRLVGVTAGA
jgi:hypothetical protein